MDGEIRILLVDDHTLFRESLGRSLESKTNFRIAGSCASAAEALQVLNRERIDIVLLDYDLGDGQGSSFVDEVKRHFQGPVLVLTAGMSDTDTVQVFISGCSGIFLKHNPLAKLFEAISKVMGGETWLDPNVVKPLVRGAAAKSSHPPQSQPLSAREHSVLKAILEGLTTKEIARKLGVSENSVKWITHQLFKKTGVRKRSQLVRIALEKHLFVTDKS
jgi:two-component system nitrate/nitrite response regulator NarL